MDSAGSAGTVAMAGTPAVGHKSRLGGQLRPNVTIEREPDHLAISDHAAGHPGIRDLTDRTQPPGRHSTMKPVPWPIGVGSLRGQSLERDERQACPPLGEDPRLSHLALEKERVLVAIPADSVFAPAERTAPVEDVVVVRIEIDAGRPVLIAKGPRAVGIGVEMNSSPAPDPGRQVGSDDELELAGVGPNLTDMCHIAL